MTEHMPPGASQAGRRPAHPAITLLLSAADLFERHGDTERAAALREPAPAH
jgi:hypothetical protein